MIHQILSIRIKGLVKHKQIFPTYTFDCFQYMTLTDISTENQIESLVKLKGFFVYLKVELIVSTFIDETLSELIYKIIITIIIF
jgi:hypothetical protein